VGVILYELICGEAPPGAKEGRIQRAPEIPEGLWKTVERLLAHAVERRPSSAREVQADLEIFLASRGLEGTRAHLADVIDQIAPQRLSPLRVLSRITQLTNLTRFTRAEGSDVPDLPRSKAPIVFASLLAIGAAAALYAAGRGEESIQAPAPPPPPPAIVSLPPPPPVEAATATLAEERPKRVKRRAAKSGWLTIDTRPWTEVYAGKRRLGLTPVVGAKLPTGRHDLTLRNDKLGLIRKITVTIRPGKTTRIQRTL
jgi:hypothetical protein